MRSIIRIMFLMRVCSAIGWAQGDRAAITGTITDQSGAVVPEATAKAVRLGTNAERTTTASPTGDFTIPALQAGTYRLEIEPKGFKTLFRSEIDLIPGLTQRLDATLQIGEVSDTVEVSAQGALLQTDNAEISTAVTQKFVNELLSSWAASCARRQTWR